jgi:hypothetical protein
LLVEQGLAPVKRDHAVVNLALVLVVRVLSAREHGLSPSYVNLDAFIDRPRRTIERTLRIVDEHLLTIEPSLMCVGDQLLQIENPLLPIDSQLLSRAILAFPHGQGVSHNGHVINMRDHFEIRATSVMR